MEQQKYTIQMHKLMKQYSLFQKMNKIKCPKHALEISYIDLSKISQDGTRIMCKECGKIEGGVTKEEFDEVCRQLLIKKQSIIENIKHQYSQAFQQIQNLLQSFDQKIQNKIFNIQNEQKLQQALEMAYSSKEKQYGLKEFEILAQIVAQEREIIEMNDQKQAESTQYLQLTQQLASVISNFFSQHHLEETQIQNIPQPLVTNEKNQNYQNNLDYLEVQEKIQTQGFSHVTGLYLNFDETVLAAKFIESVNSIQFWTFNEAKKSYIPHSVLQCHGQSLLDFQFSKVQNTFITSGLELTEKKKGEWDQYTYSIKKWDWLGDNIFFKLQDKFYEATNKRIQCIAQNDLQSLLIAGQGSSIIIFSFKNNKYNLELIRQISSEIVSVASFCEDQQSFGVGAYDSKIYVCSFLDKKFKIIQQIKLIGVPKQIIFGNEDQELFILIKDGILSINIRENIQTPFRELQRIVNNIEKIRAIALNRQFQALAIGGETNVLQIWKKNDNMQWKCKSQNQQDNFIDCICFSYLNSQILSSNDAEIYIHKY